jgi:hypothetical protein
MYSYKNLLNLEKHTVQHFTLPSISAKKMHIDVSSAGNHSHTTTAFISHTFIYFGNEIILIALT